MEGIVIETVYTVYIYILIVTFEEKINKLNTLQELL